MVNWNAEIAEMANSAIASEDVEIKGEIRSKRALYCVLAVLIILIDLGLRFFQWFMFSRPFDVKDFLVMLCIAFLLIIFGPLFSAAGLWVNFSRARSVRIELMLVELLRKNP
jgi:hypothetical protein